MVFCSGEALQYSIVGKHGGTVKHLYLGVT